MGPYYDHQVGRFEPPDPVRDREILLAHARQARAEAIAAMVGALWARLRTASGAVIALVRSAGAGAALRPPQAEDRRPVPARLTGGCG